MIADARLDPITDLTTSDVDPLPDGYEWTRASGPTWSADTRGRIAHIRDQDADGTDPFCGRSARTSGWRTLDPNVYPYPIAVCHDCTRYGVVQVCLDRITADRHHAALHVACPTCDQPKGHDCKDGTGRRQVPHIARRREVADHG